MKLLRGALLAAALTQWLLQPVLAQTIQQTGTVTPGHAVQWAIDGVVQDAGSASAGSLTSLGVTASGPGICQNSGPVTSFYNQICLSATLTGVSLDITNFGGTGGFALKVNGVSQPLISATLPVNLNDFACFTDSTGATVKACAGGGGGSPGSPNTSVQFNNSSTFGGSANLTWVSPILKIGVAGAATGQLQLTGSTSGTVTLTPQNIAGTPTITLPSASGTVAVSVSTPLLLSATTGNMTITGVAGAVLAGSGPAFTVTPTLGVVGSSNGTIAFAGSTSGTATITPQATAGSPTLILPNASGTFAVTASAPLSLSSTTGNLTLPGTAGMVLAGATPAFTATPVHGVAGSLQGNLGLAGVTSGTVTIGVGAIAGTYNFNLPITSGAAGECLASGGGGSSVMTWASCGGGAGSPGGSNTQVQYNSAGSFGGSANLTWISPILQIGVAASTTGQLKMTGSSSGTVVLTPQVAAGTPTLTFPTTTGTLVSTATSPMTINSTTGAVALPGATGTVATGSGGTTTAFSATPVLGVAGATLGTLSLAGNTSGTVVISPQAAAGAWTFLLPATAGSNRNILKTDGTTTSWATLSDIAGTATNDSASAGSVGEFVSSVVASGSAVLLSIGTQTNITTISLTAGDWDVWGTLAFSLASSDVLLFAGGIGTTSATLPSNENRMQVQYSGAGVWGTGTVFINAVPTLRLSLSGTTTVYLIGFASYSTGTVSGFGKIEARRRR